jgi:5-methylcytosine-specific restriction endonuclease McrA
VGKSTQIPTKVRRQINERDHYRCLRCGMAGTEQHHRVRRRDGGHRRSNIVLLCHDCHREVTLNPLTSKLTGYIVPPWLADAAPTTPLMTFTGAWVLLDDEGNVTPAPLTTAERA